LDVIEQMNEDLPRLRPTKLTPHDLWRVRVGDYRIVYNGVGFIVRIGHRSDIYRNL